MFSPSSSRGAMAWQEYYGDSKELEELPPINNELIDCKPLDDAVFKTDYFACQDDRYVWKCKNDDGGKLCNTYRPDSEEGAFYWDLVEGFPNEEEDYEEVWVEPTKEKFVEIFNQKIKEEPDYTKYLNPIVLDMTLDQFWNCFYANDAQFYVSDIQKDAKDVFVDKTDWHPPSEE